VLLEIKCWHHDLSVAVYRPMAVHTALDRQIAVQMNNILNPFAAAVLQVKYHTTMRTILVHSLGCTIQEISMFQSY